MIQKSALAYMCTKKPTYTYRDNRAATVHSLERGDAEVLVRRRIYQAAAAFCAREATHRRTERVNLSEPSLWEPTASLPRRHGRAQSQDPIQ